FEYVTDPYACMKNLAAAVRPGGTLLVQWPNYPPAKTGGVNYIPTRPDLAKLLAYAGLTEWQAFALHLTPHASMLYGMLHEFPLRLLRRLRRSDTAHPPQLFDDTWAFRSGHRLESLKVFAHTYWAALSTAIRLGGACFKRTVISDSSLDCNLLL